MIKDLAELAAAVAVGGALFLGGCSGDEPTDMTDTPTDEPTAGCPTAGCPTGGCPTGGCPTGGCPTEMSGWAADYATSGDFFTLQTTGPADSGSVHGTVRMYYTETLRTAIEGTPPFTAPVGAASIKELYDTGGVLAGYDVMTKQAAGWDAANNDWLYEVFDAAGNQTQSGALPGCIGCHSGGPTTDYLLGTTESN